MTTSTWRIVMHGAHLVSDTDGVLVVEGAGPTPTVEMIAQPIPVGPPDDTPRDFSPQPGEDTSPFIWPTGGPQYQTRDFDRNYPLAMELPGSDYYALERDGGNPSIMSHRDAGIIAEGGRTSYGRLVGGLRLWVRVVMGESMSGERITPAPPHLIRRALKAGHV